MKKVLLFSMLVFATGLLFSCSSDDRQDGGFPVIAGLLSYEGQTYKTVKIDTLPWWMAENLNYNPDSGTSACYDNEPSNCNTYGRLYNWSTAMDLPSSCDSTSCSNQIQSKHQGICPPGWHIPNYNDLNVLMNYVGGSSTAGKHLKARSGWNSPSDIENLDTYGFSALPGGFGGSGGRFAGVGTYGFWWSTGEYENSSDSNGSAYYRNMYYYHDSASWHYGYKTYLLSVRCLQD
ncbi:MAG: hypothetical protein LBQ87_08640 [Candidatus Fibromonas sp.]|jgi:uncharacterized protein (TIGR02145 family)|nr:hypothetical protein [Candidatus Fibromonas sp.]